MFFMAAGFWAMLLCMYPSSKGYGTHVQLGMESCGFLARHHYPCPGCGVTTSLAAMARGRLFAAFRANIFGATVFIVIMVAGGFGLFQACSGKNVFGRLKFRWWYIGVILGLLLLSWAVKLVIGINCGEYPIA